MKSQESRKLHVVLGAGQVGPKLVELLLARGERVRVVRRGAPGTERPGLEWARADLTDPSAAAEALKGADVVYDTTNPASYASWATTLFPLKRSIRTAVSRTGAFLVQLDNLYMYGRTEDGVLREGGREEPVSEKGRIRKVLSDELTAAIARGELRATVGRASDFFGPGAGVNALFGDVFVRGLARGYPALVLGDPSLPRSYSYVPDVALGLAALGADPARSGGRVFHLPVAWRDGSTRELVTRFASALDARPRMLRLPGWAFWLLGWVNADLGAIREMLYQWEAPYVVDDSLFTDTFGVRATPIDEAIRDSIAAALPERTTGLVTASSA